MAVSRLYMATVKPLPAIVLILVLFALPTHAGSKPCNGCRRAVSEADGAGAGSVEAGVSTMFAHIKSGGGEIPEGDEVHIGTGGEVPSGNGKYGLVCMPGALATAADKAANSGSDAGSSTSGSDDEHSLLRGSNSGGEMFDDDEMGDMAAGSDVCFDDDEDLELPETVMCGMRFPFRAVYMFCGGMFSATDKIVGLGKDYPCETTREFHDGVQVLPSPAETEPVLFSCSKMVYMGLKSEDRDGSRFVEPIRPGKTVPYLPFSESVTILQSSRPSLSKLRTDILTGAHPETDGKEESLQFVMDHFDRAMESYTPTAGGDIPRSLHWVWLGGDMRMMHLGTMATSARRLAGWSFTMWTDRKDIETDKVFKNIENSAGIKIKVRSVSELDVPGSYLYKFYSGHNNYGGMSDMVRMEVLHRHGGVYIDTDYLLVDTLDSLTGLHFFGGSYPSTAQVISMDVSIMGAKAGHPALKSYLKHVLSVTEEAEVAAVGAVHGPVEAAKPEHGSMFSIFRENNIRSMKEFKEWSKLNVGQMTLTRRTDIMLFMNEHSGPSRILSELFKFISAEEDADGARRDLSLVMPPTYFYPNALPETSGCKHIVPEAFGIHMDTKSWMGQVSKEDEDNIAAKVAMRVGLELL